MSDIGAVKPPFGPLWYDKGMTKTAARRFAVPWNIPTPARGRG